MYLWFLWLKDIMKKGSPLHVDSLECCLDCHPAHSYSMPWSDTISNNMNLPHSPVLILYTLSQKTSNDGRRSFTRMILSDNKKTFKAAEVFVKSCFQDATVQEYLVGQDWSFNIEWAWAPWWGGAFERLVKSLKQCLIHTCMSHLETWRNRWFHHTCWWVEECYIYQITSHLLVMYMTMSLLLHVHQLRHRRWNAGNTWESHSTTAEQGGVTSTWTSTSSQMVKFRENLIESLNYCWTRWRDQYLAELQETQLHWLNQHSIASQPCISVNDVAVVYDESVPREFWKAGWVEELRVARDGEVRGASVCLSLGHSVLWHPVQLTHYCCLVSNHWIAWEMSHYQWDCVCRLWGENTYQNQ